MSCYEKALYLDELHDDVITVLTRHASGDSGPLSRAMIIPLDGAYQDVADHDTAWGGSRAGYGIFIIGLATTPEQPDSERAWVRSLWEALMPYASGIGAYVNTRAQFEDDRVRASYGPANTNGWPGSRRSTTPTTSSTATRISNQRRHRHPGGAHGFTMHVAVDCAD